MRMCVRVYECTPLSGILCACQCICGVGALGISATEKGGERARERGGRAGGEKEGAPTAHPTAPPPASGAMASTAPPPASGAMATSL